MKRELAAAVLIAATLLVPGSGFGETPPAAYPAAYIDEVANYTRASDDEVDELLREALREAGYTALANVGNAAPCAAGDTFCLAERARARGADVAVRATWVEVATEVSLALEVVRARDAQVASYVVRRGNPEAAATIVGGLLAADRDRGPSGRTTVAWTLAGTSAALLVGGGASALRAWQQRRAFFSAHLNDDGDVVGISPPDARAAESRARAWSVAGVALLAGAAVSGVTATIMLTRSGSDGSVVLGGRF
jgi:hypothetical protein